MARYMLLAVKKKWYQVIIFSLCFEKRAIFAWPARKTRKRPKRKIVISELKAHKKKQKTFKKDIGPTRRINCTTGSSRFTIATSSISIFEGQIKSLRAWLASSAQDKLNSAEAIIKKWRKSTIISIKFFSNWEVSSTILQIRNYWNCSYNRMTI